MNIIQEHLGFVEAHDDADGLKDQPNRFLFRDVIRNDEWKQYTFNEIIEDETRQLDVVKFVEYLAGAKCKYCGFNQQSKFNEINGIYKMRIHFYSLNDLENINLQDLKTIMESFAICLYKAKKYSNNLFINIDYSIQEI